MRESSGADWAIAASWAAVCFGAFRLGGGPGAAAPVSEARPMPPEEPLRLELQAFVDAMGGGPPPSSNAAEALGVVRVLGAAQESLDSGDTVILDSTGHDHLET